MQSNIIKAASNQRKRLFLQAIGVTTLYGIYFQYNRMKYNEFSKNINLYHDKALIRAQEKIQSESTGEYISSDELFNAMLNELYENFEDSNPLNQIPQFSDLGLFIEDEFIVEREKFHIFSKKHFFEALLKGVTEDLRKATSGSERKSVTIFGDDNVNVNNTLESNITSNNDAFRGLKRDEKGIIYKLRVRLQVLAKYLASNERRLYDLKYIEEYNQLIPVLLKTISNTEWIYDRYYDIPELYALDNEMKHILLVMARDQSFHRCIAEKNAESLVSFLSKKNTITSQRDEFQHEYYNQLLRALFNTNNGKYQHLFEFYPELFTKLKAGANITENRNHAQESYEQFMSRLQSKRIESSPMFNTLLSGICFTMCSAYIVSRLHASGLPARIAITRSILSSLLLTAAFYQDFIFKQKWRKDNIFFPIFNNSFVRMDTFATMNMCVCAWFAWSIGHYTFLPFVLLFTVLQLGQEIGKEQL